MATYENYDTIASLASMDGELAQVQPNMVTRWMSSLSGIQILATSPLPKPDLSDLSKFRQVQNAAEHDLWSQGTQTEIHEHTIKIPMRDNFENEALVYQHVSTSSAGNPLVVLCYGGGFVLGTNKQLAHYSRAISLLYRAVVVNISYRLAPEHSFPIPANDVWDNVEWLSKNSHIVGADLSAGFILGGESAGANLTAVTAHKAARMGLSPSLTGLFVTIPLLFTEDVVPAEYKASWFSRSQNADVPLLDSAALQAFMDIYRPDQHSPDFSPYNDVESFSKLPKTYVQVCGMDPLRDDGLIYEKTLRGHGVDTRLDVYPGVPHAFSRVFPQLTQAFKFDVDTVLGFGWLLSRRANRAEVERFFESYSVVKR
jgi:acetyl esterase/lipase